MLEPSILEPEELDENNFQEFLDDETFLNYFNTFLALPCFAERLYYNKEFAQFEEFVERLADDIGKGDAAAAYQLRKLTHFKGTIYNVTNNQSRIGYYVMVLDTVEATSFVKAFRLPVFLKSELYAEYKLTMILSTIQSTLIGSFGEYEDVFTNSFSAGSRRRSIVSFNLDNPEQDDDDNAFSDRNTADSPHVRTIGDTFNAWQASFKRADSRLSLFSYTGDSTLKTPETMADSDSDTSSILSDKVQNPVPLKSRRSNSGILRRGSAKVTWQKSLSIEDEVLNASVSAESQPELELSKSSEDGKVSDMRNANQDERNEIKLQESENSESATLLNKDSQDKVNDTELIENERNNIAMEQNVDKREENYAANNYIVDENDSEINEKSTPENQHPPKMRIEASEETQENAAISSKSASVTDGDESTKESFSNSKIRMYDENGSEKEMLSANISCENGEDELDSIDNYDDTYEDKTVVSGKFRRTLKSNPSTTSLSEISSEVSIPIIVSDENSERISDEISITNDVQSMDEEFENRKGRAKEIDIDERETRRAVQEYEISYENDVSEDTIANKDDKDKLEERNDLAENEQPIESEKYDGNRGRRQSRLVTPDGEDADLGFDCETNSEYTLKGIRGILRRRASIAATSVGFDFDQSDISDDDDYLEEEKPYDLSTKEGLDEFKMFLLGTVAEKYLRFWIDVECLRHEKNKDSMLQIILPKYFKKGSLYELTQENIKCLNVQELSKVTYDELKEKCCHIMEPIMNYWCARFTMHQQSPSTSTYLDPSKSPVSREHGSASVALDPDACGMSQVTYTKELLRPQSSRTHAQNDGDGSRPVTAKQRLRAKSAHPRLIPATTPTNTNASTVQLQNITSPVRGNYGFKPKKPPTFSNVNEPDYMSSVRLYINPIPTPDGKLTKMLGRFKRTTVSPYSQHEARITSSDHSKTTTDDLMDSLIEGLILEKQTGGYFESYLHKVENKLWLDCLSFWKDLQDYNALFFADSLNPSNLKRKAMLMYARYIVGSGTQAIGVSRDIERQVFKQVDPPYEELFDAVEDHALRCLVEPWKHLHNKESISYDTVRKEQKLRHIEIQVMAKRRQSVVQTREHDGTESDIEKEKISIDEANRPMPIPKDGFSFETLIRTRSEVEFFREFLSKKHNKGIKDLMAWTDMETFRRLPRFMDEKRNQKAKDVKKAWLSKKYFFGPDSPATREGQDLIMNINGGRNIKERPSTPVITECQKFVRARIERRWLMLFKQTTEFMERQKPRVTAPEVVEDVMLKRRLQRSEAAWKILNSRWVSSSRDVVALRSCLLNPQTCNEFKTFVALKGDTYENDVDFWLEVQKFKDLCHAHSQDGFIRRKVQAISDCFLNSAIAPELQIDIPIEMADKLLERLTGRITVHPYIFREAQMTVFRMLFNHWKEFIAYRNKVPANQTLQEHLDEKLKTQRAENKAKRDASERRRLARLSAERKKKEKEERERKRMEDLTSLFSIDTTSVFYSEAPEDELNSWVYSKHVVEQERQEHIKRLKEQGLEIPPELLVVEDKDENKSRRSRLSSSKLQALDSKSFRGKMKAVSVVDTIFSDKDWSDKEGRKSPLTQAKLNQILQKQQATNRRDSLSPSVFAARRGSVYSRKSDKQSAKDENKPTEAENKPIAASEEMVKKPEEKKASPIQKPQTTDEIQVIPDKEDNHGNDKLLNARAQKNKRTFCKPQKTKKKGVPLDAISCISDYSEFSNIDYQQSKRAISSKRKSGSATPLTFKSLKDFTDSPEGAPLAIPLPLVRITSASVRDAASDDDGSQGNPTRSRKVFASTHPRLNSAKRKNMVSKQQECIVPDVIVN